MYCKKCGVKLPEDSLFCHMCGEPVERPVEGQNTILTSYGPISSIMPPDNGTTSNTEHKSAYSPVRSAVTCPRCGNQHMRIQVQKNVHTSTTDGYSASDGCCGYILFGPLGLLCGIGGNQKTNVTETSAKLWVCDNCGNSFRDRNEIKEEYLKAKRVRNNCIIQGIVASIITVIFFFIMLSSIGNDALKILGLPILLIGIIVPVIFFGIKWAIENEKLEPLRDEFRESAKAYPDGEKTLDYDDDDDYYDDDDDD